MTSNKLKNKINFICYRIKYTFVGSTDKIKFDDHTAFKIRIFFNTSTNICSWSYED